ncbi:MAG: hypothetical protein ACR2JY_22780 [Chloroflexota bacterium]
MVGAISAFVALALLRLIGLFTNLFFFQRWDTTLVSPASVALWTKVSDDEWLTPPPVRCCRRTYSLAGSSFH